MENIRKIEINPELDEKRLQIKAKSLTNSVEYLLNVNENIKYQEIIDNFINKFKPYDKDKVKVEFSISFTNPNNVFNEDNLLCKEEEARTRANSIGDQKEVKKEPEKIIEPKSMKDVFDFIESLKKRYKNYYRESDLKNLDKIANYLNSLITKFKSIQDILESMYNTAISYESQLTSFKPYTESTSPAYYWWPTNGYNFAKTRNAIHYNIKQSLPTFNKAFEIARILSENIKSISSKNHISVDNPPDINRIISLNNAETDTKEFGNVCVDWWGNSGYPLSRHVSDHQALTDRMVSKYNDNLTISINSYQKEFIPWLKKNFVLIKALFE